MSAYFVCEVCGCQFKRWNSANYVWKTCSMKCRNILYRRRGAIRAVYFACQWCRAEFRIRQKPRPDMPHKFCSFKCAVAAKAGVRRLNRKGSRFLAWQGYVFLCLPNGRRIFEHRLIMERALGRILLAGEVVHHANGKKADNRPDNLVLMTRSQHGREHISPAEARIRVLKKLTPDNVRNIWQLCASGHIQRTVAVKYGVSQGAITDIICNKTWRHI